MTIPKISSQEVIKVVAKNSSLTKSQVKECFSVYSDFVLSISKTESKPKELYVSLPFLGNMVFKMRKGSKKGKIINYTNLITGEKVKKIFDEDMPDYYLLNFKPIRRISELLKKENNE